MEKKLNSEITTLDNLIKTDPNNYNHYINRLEEVNKQLENIRNIKIEGNIIRSRASWYELGEKSTSYFCNLEKRNQLNKTIHELDDNGKLVSNIDEILNVQKKFYENLYSNKDNFEIDIDDFTSKIEIEQLTKLEDSTKNKIEGYITYTELLNSLKRSKNNKSPGLDGFTMEFYKFFWLDLGHFLLKSINYAYNCGQLSVTQKQGIITCIPKPNKPRNILKNWRPLTLLNTAYKLASSCIAERIKTCLNTIISNDQNGFIPGRYIGDNTRMIYDVMFETARQNIPGMLMLIDFEKAFDSVSWRFINKVLELYNFGPSIRKWIELFQFDTESCIVQNGYFSNFFKLARGCRQGDPISPYLFIICAEILGEAVRQNKHIKGINIWGQSFKISQFADDTALLLDGSEDSFNAAFDTLEWFYTISGLKTNIDKTKIIWIGSMKDSDRRFCRENNPEWTNKFTILGIHYNNSLENITELNLRPRINSLKIL